MKLEYDSKTRKGKLIYPEKVIERSLGKVPPSKDLIDKHLHERGSMFRISLMLTAIFSVIGILGTIFKIINGFDNLYGTSISPQSVRVITEEGPFVVSLNKEAISKATVKKDENPDLRIGIERKNSSFHA